MSTTTSRLAEIASEVLNVLNRRGFSSIEELWETWDESDVTDREEFFRREKEGRYVAIKRDFVMGDVVQGDAFIIVSGIMSPQIPDYRFMRITVPIEGGKASEIRIMAERILNESGYRKSGDLDFRGNFEQFKEITPKDLEYVRGELLRLSALR